MYCQRCGAQLSENTIKCPHCGAKYSTENTAAPTTNEKTAPRKIFFTKKKIIITLIIAVVLIAGGITATVTLSNGSSISVSTSDMLQLADRYLKEMNYEQAIVEFQKILEIEPKNVDAYIGLAEAYVGLGDTDKAIEALKQGQENTGSKKVGDRLREIQAAAETTTEATISTTEAPLTTTEITTVETTTAVVTSTTEAIVTSTTSNVVTTTETTTITAPEEVTITTTPVATTSVSTSDMLQLAHRYLKEMNYEQAIVEIQKVLEIEPKNVNAYIELAEIYFGLGDMDKVIEVLDRGYENTDSEEIENKIRKIIYADLQDKAKSISNICNMCLSDFFMAGYDDFCKTPITGEKTNGSLLKIKVDDKDELDDSLDESYKFFISNLTNNLDMLLPNDCWFSIEVAQVGVVKGVIYTITNPVELLPPVGYEAEVYKVKGFDSAYKLTDKDGIDIGVCGSYIR